MVRQWWDWTFTHSIVAGQRSDNICVWIYDDVGQQPFDLVDRLRAFLVVWKYDGYLMALRTMSPDFSPTLKGSGKRCLARPSVLREEMTNFT